MLESVDIDRVILSKRDGGVLEPLLNQESESEDDQPSYDFPKNLPEATRRRSTPPPLPPKLFRGKQNLD